MNSRWAKKNLLEIAVILLAAVVFGLGRNYLSQTPLLLFRAHAKAIKPDEVRIHFSDADAELVSQMGNSPGTMLLDARPPELFSLGFIPGAVNLPVATFAASLPPLLPRLRAAHLLIVYCGGPHCPDAADLAIKLFEKGFKDLLIYRGGMQDWQRRGNAFAR
jgi:rhodanese-related sulfurtransferase